MAKFPTTLTGICSSCGMDTQLTRDHRVPRWIERAVSSFGFTHKQVCHDAGFENTYEFLSVMCEPCNQAKSGSIDWKDPVVRKYMRAFLLLCYEQLKKPEGPQKIRVTCGCGRKEPCAVVPGVMEYSRPSPAVSYLPKDVRKLSRDLSEQDISKMSPREAHEARL